MNHFSSMSCIRWIAFATAVVGMGIGMPSCPGQQAMQQQVETLQTSNADLSKRVQSLEGTLRTTTNEMTQIKQLLTQITGAIQAQKTSIEQLNTTVGQLQSSKGTRSTPTKRRR
ncbi:MAG TPA: hypothetical protein VJB59_11540 [Bdellovibrionota bacterium]|nr:hypothetical protein [Bdellovibrionota bacterium]